MKAEWVIRRVASTVPAAHRRERLEEWLADLGGCAELGIPPRQIAIGAVLSTLAYGPAPKNRPAPTNGYGMSDHTRHALRLVLYVATIAGAVAWVWVHGTHLSASGGNVGLHLPGGVVLDLVLLFLVGGVVVGGLAVAFGYRSLRLFRSAAAAHHGDA
jgi:hypothetical protein